MWLCGPQTSSFHIIWELTGNADSQVLPTESDSVFQQDVQGDWMHFTAWEAPLSRTELPSRYVRTHWWVGMISRCALETSSQPSSAFGAAGSSLEAGAPASCLHREQLLHLPPCTWQEKAWATVEAVVLWNKCSPYKDFHIYWKRCLSIAANRHSCAKFVLWTSQWPLCVCESLNCVNSLQPYGQ